MYYTHVLSDTIWQIRENGHCEARYVFKAPGRDKNLFDEEDFRTLTDERYKSLTKDALYLTACYLTRDFIYAESKGNYLLYCIPTGHYIYSPRISKDSCKFYLPSRNFADQTLHGTSFVKTLDPTPIYRKHHNLSRLYDRDTFREYWEGMNNEEKRVLEKVQENGNPIFMVMDVEPF